MWKFIVILRDVRRGGSRGIGRLGKESKNGWGLAWISFLFVFFVFTNLRILVLGFCLSFSKNLVIRVFSVGFLGYRYSVSFPRFGKRFYQNSKCLWRFMDSLTIGFFDD